MKASRSGSTPFQPVTLTLETQAEVDGIYAFFRHVVSGSFGFPSVTIAKCLEPFVRLPDDVFTKFDAEFRVAWKCKLRSDA